MEQIIIKGQKYGKQMSPNDKNTLKKNFDFLLLKRELINTLTIDSFDAFFSTLSKENKLPETSDLPAVFENITGRLPEKAYLPDFALFCCCFTKYTRVTPTETVFSSLLVRDRVSKIVYLQNMFSDRAYNIFAKALHGASASYLPGFHEICEEVYYERCDYAIFPIYTSKEGQLISFRKLISKYDLQIALECDIETNDETVMRFALVKKGMGDPSFMNPSYDKCRFMDVSIVPDEDPRIAEIFLSLDALGAKVMSVNSIPLEYLTDRYSFDIQLDIENASLKALLTFFEASHLRYDVAGIFDIAEA